MPNDNLTKNSGFVAELRARIAKQSESDRQKAEAVYKAFVETSVVETPGASNQKNTSVNQAQSSDSQEYAELVFKPAQRSFKKTSAEESTTYSEILRDSGEEKVQAQIAILKDQKKEYLEKLNQAISENKKDDIQDYSSQLTAIEVSLATKQHHLERNKILSLEQSEALYKPNLPETHEVDLATVTIAEDGTRGIIFENQPVQEPLSETEDQQTQEVTLAQEDIHFQGPAVDRTKKPGVSSEDELVEKRQKKGAPEKRVQFTQSTLEKDESKEQGNLLSKQSSQEVVKPKSATTQTRLKEPNAISQLTSDPNGVANPAPQVDRKLKPRLAHSDLLSSPNFFSKDQSDQKEKKEKRMRSFAYRQ